MKKSEKVNDLDAFIQILPPRNGGIRLPKSPRKLDINKYGVSKCLVQKTIKQILAEMRKRLS